MDAPTVARQLSARERMAQIFFEVYFTRTNPEERCQAFANIAVVSESIAVKNCEHVAALRMRAAERRERILTKALSLALLRLHELCGDEESVDEVLAIVGSIDDMEVR